MTHYRPTWAEISSAAFISNLQQIKSLITPSVRLMAVLKADGYGHGAVPLARLAVQHGASSIGVSSLEEGIALREERISAPILILGGIYPLDNFSVALEYGLTPTVASLEAAQALKSEARKKGKPAAFHLKIDTGMGRIGVSPARAETVLDFVLGEPLLQLEGVYSHLACAESDESFSREQLRQFDSVRSLVKTRGIKNVLFHIAGSAAVVSGASFHLDLVRPGLALYGVWINKLPRGVELFPVLSWQTKLIFLKKVPAGTSISYGATYRARQETDVATLPVGYADGLPRRASNKGAVLIRGKRCPIIGRVTMDHIMVDVTGAGAGIGDSALLIGKQENETLTVNDWADWADTSPYEILCGISKRVPRIVT